MSKADGAQLIAGAAVALLIAVLAAIARRDTVVLNDAEYTLPDGTVRKVSGGAVVPQDEIQYLRGGTLTKRQRRSVLGAAQNDKAPRCGAL